MKTPLSKILLSEWLIGGVLTIYFMAAYLGNWSNLQAMELITFDLRAPLRADHAQSMEIEIVAVDDESIGKIGPWPWPRALMGQLIENLKSSGAKVIGVNFPFSEPDESQGIKELRAMRQKIVAQAEAAAARRPDGRVQAAYRRMLQDLSETEANLDQDAKLAAALANSPQVILPISFEIGKSRGNEGPEPSSRIFGSSFNTIDNLRDLSVFPPIGSRKLIAPLPAFQQDGIGFGHVNIVPDPDGILRNETLLVEYRDHFYPSFALRVVSAYLNLPPREVHIGLGQYITLGRIHIPTNHLMQMPVSYNGPAGTFKPFSAHHVLYGKIPASTFRGKIVLVGPVAAGIGARYETPMSRSIAGVEVMANVIQNILDQNFLVVPSRAKAFVVGTLVFVGLFLVVGFPLLGNKWSGIVAGTLLILYVWYAAFVFAKGGYVITVLHPTLLLVLGYTIITTKRVLLSNHGEALEADTYETNKMLGVSFQGQGMLDLAFEKFMKCPLTKETMSLLYNLGIDFERKRMFNKAVTVYEHIATKDRLFKDIEERIERLKQLGDQALMGSSLRRGGADASLLVQGSGVLPTLGRYEVLKELGRGAMGVVYLGKDPKIQRFVAIKTMRLDEVESEELPEIKQRFFREASSAGKLSHPNIVTIFDAGEEQDMAYFAMEVLDGKSLTELCSIQKLLPVRRVAEIVARVAEALDYAHAQGVVHRDIKPSNIMVMSDGNVKVTDFGIARLASSGRTQSGRLLGTPNYMSPEQISGHAVDGRSDLFSLGVVLYVLLTGERPFQGDSLATLMYMSTNQPHPSPLSIRPELPPAFIAIIDRALEKDPTRRYQRGQEMAQDLRAALQGVRD